jgi:hypothetical protein
MQRKSRMDDDDWWMTSGRRTADDDRDNMLLDDDNNGQNDQPVDDRPWSVSELPRSLPILPVEVI